MVMTIINNLTITTIISDFIIDSNFMIMVILINHHYHQFNHHQFHDAGKTSLQK